MILNKILKPIISIVSVQDVVLENINYYEPLLMKYIGQASDLRVELEKLHSSTQNADLKALINRLGIIDTKEEKDEILTK